ncbi:hypothetical protein VaNZ11_016887, partial [Volvox africanus]
MSLEDGWRHLARDGKVRGPHTLLEIRGLLQRGQLSGETEVHHDQMGWRFLGSVLLGASYKHPSGEQCCARGPAASAQGLEVELQASSPPRCSPATANPCVVASGAGGAAKEETENAASIAETAIVGPPAGPAAAARPLQISSARATVGADDEEDRTQQLPPQPLSSLAADDTDAGCGGRTGLRERQGTGKAKVRIRGVIPARRTVPGKINSSRQTYDGDDGPSKPSGSNGGCGSGATMTTTDGGDPSVAAVAETAGAAAGTDQVGFVNNGIPPQGRIFFDPEIGPQGTAQDFLIPGDSDDDDAMKVGLGALREQRESPPGCESQGGVTVPSPRQGLFLSSGSETIDTTGEDEMTAKRHHAMLGALRRAADRPGVKRRRQQQQDEDVPQNSLRQRRQLSADSSMESVDANRWQPPPSVPSALPNAVAKKARTAIMGHDAAAAGASNDNRGNTRHPAHAFLPAKRANGEEQRFLKRRKLAVMEVAKGVQRPAAEAAVGSGDGTVGMGVDFDAANPRGGHGGKQALVAAATLAPRQAGPALQRQLSGSRGAGVGRKANDINGIGSAGVGGVVMNVGDIAVAAKYLKDVPVRPAAAVLASGSKSLGGQTHGSRSVEGFGGGVAAQVARDQTQKAMPAPRQGTASVSGGGRMALSAVQRSQPNVPVSAGSIAAQDNSKSEDALKASAAATGKRLQGSKLVKTPVTATAESGIGSATNSSNGSGGTSWRSLSLTFVAPDATEGQEKDAAKAARIEVARRARQALRPPNFASILGSKIPPIAKHTDLATPAASQELGLFDLWNNLEEAERKVLEATCLHYDLVIYWEYGYRLGNREQHITILQLKDKIDRGELLGSLPVTCLETGDGTIANAVLAEHAEALACLEESLRTKKPMRTRAKAPYDIFPEEAQPPLTWGFEEPLPDSTRDGHHPGGGCEGGGQRDRKQGTDAPANQAQVCESDGAECNGGVRSVPEDLPSTWADLGGEPPQQPHGTAHQANE